MTKLINGDPQSGAVSMPAPCGDALAAARCDEQRASPRSVYNVLNTGIPRNDHWQAHYSRARHGGRQACRRGEIRVVAARRAARAAVCLSDQSRRSLRDTVARRSGHGRGGVPVGVPGGGLLPRSGNAARGSAFSVESGVVLRHRRHRRALSCPAAGVAVELLHVSRQLIRR